MKHLFFFCSLFLSQIIYGQKLGLSDYEKPELLLKLEAYEKEGEAFKSLGFQLDDKRHSVSIPLDVIPFASAEYFHIGFLTDFGRISDLAAAPIVLVNSSPWEKEYTVALAAENLEMFVALLCEVQTAHVYDYLTFRKNGTGEAYDEWLYEAVYLSQAQISAPLSKDAWIQQLQADRAKAVQYLQKHIGDVRIDDVGSYLETLNQKRINEISMETQDGLGIIVSGAAQLINEVDYEGKVTPDQVNKFLSEASKPERLRFYRDATFGESNETYLFERMDKDEAKQLKKVMADYLAEDGYEYEARVLKKYYK
ncbi:MAG: hypothetical protein RLO17_14600 [Cyclobacteriaceae bacterium]